MSGAVISFGMNECPNCRFDLHVVDTEWVAQSTFRYTQRCECCDFENEYEIGGIWGSGWTPETAIERIKEKYAKGTMSEEALERSLDRALSRNGAKSVPEEGSE